MLDVRRGRDERSELDHAPLAASSLELPALVELVDERDRVDRLALRPQRERGEVHLRVALAVEIPCCEDLADGSDGDRGEQHRPEHGLLGLEVLWWDDRAQAVADALEVDAGGLGLAHGVGSQAVREGRVQPERGAPSSQGERTSFPTYPRLRTNCQQAAANCQSGNTRSERKLPRILHTTVEKTWTR